MGINALRIEYPSLRVCEKCHRKQNFLYKIELDGYIILVCSSWCAESARKNWQEKKDKSIKPGVPVIKDYPMLDKIGDNILE